ARAHDAALGVVDDGRAEAHTLGLVHRLGALALELLLRGEPVVLELALAGLVADRAVDRVVQEQELLRALLRLERVGALGEDLHALARDHLAGGLELRLRRRSPLLLLLVPPQRRQRHLAPALDLHEAHPAVRRDAQPGMPAVVRDLHAGAPRRADDRVTLLEGDVLSVQLESGHRKVRSARGSPRGRELTTQRSHSPPIMLIEPKVGTMSGTMSPMSISRHAARLYQQGGRQRTR